MYQNIIVPVDGSETAQRALREATQLAASLSSRIRLIHVVNSTPWITQGAPGVIEELLTQMRSTGESIIHEAKTVVRAAGIEVDDRLIEAIGERAGEFVVSEANDWPADLIVCGTHGRRGLRRLLMGGDAEYIVHYSPVPVLLVRGS
ncbi:MAG TPA: universal stress protein [Steroidobacteraceae bacterium]|nr:universal stress protein [Steroidobacteraceae bacterium]